MYTTNIHTMDATSGRSHSTSTIDGFIRAYHATLSDDPEASTLLRLRLALTGDRCVQCQKASHYVIWINVEGTDDPTLCFMCARVFIKRQALLTPRWLFHERVNTLMNIDDPDNEDDNELLKPSMYNCDHCDRHYVGMWYKPSNHAICDNCQLCGTASYFIGRLIYLHRLQILPVDICCYIIGMLFDHLAFSDQQQEQKLQSDEHRFNNPLPTRLCTTIVERDDRPFILVDNGLMGYIRDRE